MSRAGGLSAADAFTAQWPGQEAPRPFADGFAAAVRAPDAEVRDLDDPAVLGNKRGFREAIAYATNAARPWQYAYDNLNLYKAPIPLPANYMGVSVGKLSFPGGAEAASAPGGMEKVVTSTPKIPEHLVLRTQPIRWQLH